MKKRLDFYCFVTLYGLLSLENNLNIPSKRNKHKNVERKKFIFVTVLKFTEEKIRFRSWSQIRIRNTAFDHMSEFKANVLLCKWDQLTMIA